MAMLKSFIIKNWKVLFNIQWISFSIFILTAALYYMDKNAHSSFNRNMETMDIQSLFSFMMTCLFAFFAVAVLVYPLLFLIQLLLVGKSNGKKLLILFVLYLLVIISVLSLYTINSSHAIKAIQPLN